MKHTEAGSIFQRSITWVARQSARRCSSPGKASRGRRIQDPAQQFKSNNKKTNTHTKKTWPREYVQSCSKFSFQRSLWRMQKILFHVVVAQDDRRTLQ
ncbi:hypothetical protein ANANG_G00123170, partial [Anguilla anguilla]